MAHLLVTTMSMMCAVALAGNKGAAASDAADAEGGASAGPSAGASSSTGVALSLEEYNALALEVPQMISRIADLARSARRLTIALGHRLEHDDLQFGPRNRSRSTGRARSGPSDVGAGQLGEPGVVPVAKPMPQSQSQVARQQSHSVLDPAIGADEAVIEGHGSQSQSQSSKESWFEESQETYYPPLRPGEQVQHS